LWLLTHPDLRDTMRVKAVFQVLLADLGRAMDASRTSEA
jgi:hypothetical protein